jgi:membrane protein YdbS with pleckstrin-like domain
VAQPKVDYLQPGEKIALETTRHPLSILDDLLGLLIAALFVVVCTVYGLSFAPSYWPTVGLPILITAAVLLGSLAMTRIWRVRTSRYIVTPERVYKSHGRIRFFLGQTTYDRLTDIHVKQSLFGRRYNFGTLRLQTAGEGLHLEGIRDPIGSKRLIEQARQRFVASLTGRAAKTAAAGQAASLGVGDGQSAELWQGRPAITFLLGQILWTAFLVLFGIGAVIGGALVNPFYIVFGGVMFLFAAATAVSAWAQYRFTRYHIHGDGVVVTSGWLTRRRVETTYGKVTDVLTYQPLLGRIFNFGHITINTAGSTTAPVVFRGVPDPSRVKAIVDEARRAWGKAQ